MSNIEFFKPFDKKGHVKDEVLKSTAREFRKHFIGVDFIEETEKIWYDRPIEFFKEYVLPVKEAKELYNYGIKQGAIEKDIVYVIFEYLIKTKEE